MAYKRQPLDKTIVTELNIFVADLYVRQKQLKAAKSLIVDRDSNYRTGDFNLNDTSVLPLIDIKSCLIISAWDSFVMDIHSGTNMVSVICSGIFISYSAFERVDIKKHLADNRIAYICA